MDTAAARAAETRAKNARIRAATVLCRYHGRRVPPQARRTRSHGREHETEGRQRPAASGASAATSTDGADPQCAEVAGVQRGAPSARRQRGECGAEISVHVQRAARGTPGSRSASRAGYRPRGTAKNDAGRPLTDRPRGAAATRRRRGSLPPRRHRRDWSTLTRTAPPRRLLAMRSEGQPQATAGPAISAMAAAIVGPAEQQQRRRRGGAPSPSASAAQTISDPAASSTRLIVVTVGPKYLRSSGAARGDRERSDQQQQRQASDRERGGATVRRHAGTRRAQRARCNRDLDQRFPAGRAQENACSRDDRLRLPSDAAASGAKRCVQNIIRRGDGRRRGRGREQRATATEPSRCCSVSRIGSTWTSRSPSGDGVDEKGGRSVQPR